MTQFPNQFKQTPEVGTLDLRIPGASISCQVDADQATALVPGQAVAIVDSAGGVPKVEALAADTDVTFGFVVRNLKDIDFPAEKPVEIAFYGAVMFMKAGAAIARGAFVEFDVSDNEVITAAGTNPSVGIALDKAGAADDIIRVLIQTPAQADFDA